MIIAVDAMGGDNAPYVVVQGAIQASAEEGIEVLLVGDSKAISHSLKDVRIPDKIRIHHCDEAVLMEESPLKALRSKRDSSIMTAFDLLKRREVDAVVSAGNSGATMVAGILKLGKIEGVERPAIACMIPGEKGTVILLDVGGTVDCRPVHLLQFGLMADAFASACLGIDRPRSCLLSIGQEAGKGNEQIREAYNLLKESGINFIGNLEGGDVLTGNADIVICDGFVGNIVLKMSEGVAESISHKLKMELNGSITGRMLSLIGRNLFKRVNKTLDYAELGGAPILGIKGVGIVCHGRSSSRAIKNAIIMAAKDVNNRVQERLSMRIAQLHE